MATKTLHKRRREIQGEGGREGGREEGRKEVVVHAFNPSTQEAEAGKSEFEATLVYRSTSRTTSATQ